MKPHQDWGVPNWKIETEYQVPSGTRALLNFAWQFLRRNHEYRTFWVEKVVPVIDADGQWIDEPNGIGHILDEAESRFGIVDPREPTMNRGAYFAAAGVHQLRYIKSNNGICDISLKESDVGFIFDMTLPLEGQFVRALESAKRHQERRKQQGVLSFKNTKVRIEKYISYLRILDADDAAADPNEIGEALFPSLGNEYPDWRRRTALRDSRNAARRLRDQDYRLLVSAWAASSEK
jgi:hypothetical protein